MKWPSAKIGWPKTACWKMGSRPYCLSDSDHQIPRAIDHWEALYFLAVICAFGLAGCSRGPAIAQVSGKVLYKDGSVPKGGVRIVRFEPTEDTTAEIRQPAGGSIGPDGSFVLSTRKPGDGVYCGKYAVTFTVWKAPRDPVSLIKEEYTRSATTPYHVTVDQDVDDLVFEIEPLGAGGNSGVE